MALNAQPTSIYLAEIMYGSGGFSAFVQSTNLDTHTLKIYWMQSDQASGILILCDDIFSDIFINVN